MFRRVEGVFCESLTGRLIKKGPLRQRGLDRSLYAKVVVTDDAEIVLLFLQKCTRKFTSLEDDSIFKASFCSQAGRHFRLLSPSGVWAP